MKRLLLVIFALHGALIADAQPCLDVPTIPSLLGCPAPGALVTPVLPNVLTKNIMISFTAQIKDLCSKSYATVLSMTIKSGAQILKILDISWRPATNAYMIQTRVNAAGILPIASAVMSSGYSPIDEWIEFTALLSIDTGYAMGVISGASFKEAAGPIPIPYLTNMWFDSNTKIFLGADNNINSPSNQISCVLANLVIKYEPPGWPFPDSMIGGVLAGVRDYFPLNEDYGFQLYSASGASSIAYLGSSTLSNQDPNWSHLPAWIPGRPGLSFIQGTEYVTLPSFIPVASNPLTVHSISVSFWLNLPSPMSFDGYIFRISSDDLMVEKFALKYSSTTSSFENTVGGILSGSTFSMTGIWSHITVGLALRSDYHTYFASVYSSMGGSIFPGSLIIPLSFSSSDVFRIGGPPSFIGQIAHFRILSPGTNAMFAYQSTNVASPTCAQLPIPGARSTIGLSAVLDYYCDASCSECFGTQSDNCLACSGSLVLYRSSCFLVCPTKTYLSGSVCIDCPPECDSCLDSMTCQTCIPGYKIYHGQCILCDTTCDTCFNSQPSGCLTCQTGLILHGSSCLIGCPSGCDTCTNNGACTSCLSGYALDGSLCVPCYSTCQTCSSSQIDACITCKPGFKLQGTTCILECPSGCSTCTSSTTCDVCLPGYALENSLCVPCASSCATCLSSQPNGCLTCQPGLSLQDSQCIRVSSPTPLPAPEIENAESITSFKDTTKSITKYALLAASFCFLGNSQAIFIDITARMIEYIKYLDITYSEELRFLLKHSNSKDLLTIPFGIRQPQTVQNDQNVYKPLPYVFAEYDVNPSFLHNLWDTLLFIAIVIAVFLSAFALEKILSKSKNKVSHSIVKKIRERIQNVLLILIYAIYGDVIFLSILEFRSVQLDSNISIPSFSISLFFVLVGAFIFGCHLKFIRNCWKQKNKQGEELSKQNKGAEVLLHDFKNQSFDQQAFLLIYVGRSILFFLTLATLFEHPRVGAPFITIFSVGMMVYLIIKRPMQTLNLAQVVIAELILLIVNSCVLTMAFLDNNHSQNIGVRTGSSKVIIYISTIFYFVPLMFISTNLIMKLINLYKQRRLKRSVSVIKPVPPVLTKENKTYESSTVSMASERTMIRSHVILPKSSRRGLHDSNLEVSQDFSQDISLNYNLGQSNLFLKQNL